MKQYELLKKRSVLFSQGMSLKEIEETERIYSIVFPREIKRAYMFALPISHGFYNWRERKEEYVNHVKKVINRPLIELVEDADYIDWNETWGEELYGDEKKEYIKRRMKLAPKLIPVFSHRYAISGDMNESPVFSINGSDIICYGKNYLQYLEIEFGQRSIKEIRSENSYYASLWSELAM